MTDVLPNNATIDARTCAVEATGAGTSGGKSERASDPLGVRAGLRGVSSLWKQWGVWFSIALILGLCWDRAVYLHISVGASLADPQRQQELKHALEAQPLFRAVKFLGELYVPAALAGLMLLFGGIRGFLVGPTVHAVGTPKARRSSGRALAAILRAPTLVLLTPLLAGVLAELCKGLARRQRPLVALDDQGSGGWFMFRWWWDGPLDWRNLGFGSSHAAVAMGLALALCGLCPRLAWARAMFLVLAAAVGFSRILCGAHFLSDVLMGLACAATAWAFVRAADAANNPTAPLGATRTSRPPAERTLS